MSSPDPKVLPIHSLVLDPGAGRVRRRPGRPRKVEPAPTIVEDEYNRLVAEQRQQHLAKDPVLSALKQRDDGMEVVHRSLLALAQEAASLRFARERGELEGKDIAVVASRRIDALSKMASIILATQKLGEGDLNASPATVRKVVAVWLVHLAEIVRELLPADDAGRLLSAYEARLRMLPELGLDEEPSSSAHAVP